MIQDPIEALKKTREIIAAQPFVAREIWFQSEDNCYCFIGAFFKVHGYGVHDPNFTKRPSLHTFPGARLIDRALQKRGWVNGPMAFNDKNGRDEVLKLIDDAISLGEADAPDAMDPR